MSLFSREKWDIFLASLCSPSSLQQTYLSEMLASNGFLCYTRRVVGSMTCRTRRRLKYLGSQGHRWEGITIMAMQQERWISLEEYLELDRTSLNVKYG